MTKTNILIVEDVSIAGQRVKQSLEQCGYHVVDVVSSGTEAIDKARAYRPDLVLMGVDIDGEIDGIKAARYIYKQLDIPVIYLTASSDDKTLQRAIQTEPFGYITSQLNNKVLFAIIEIALHKYRAEKALKASKLETEVAFSSKKSSQELLSVSEQRLLSEIQSILFTTEEVVKNANLVDLLDFVATQTKHLTNADGVAVLLISDDRESLNVASVSTLQTGIEVGLQTPAKGSIVEEVLTTHKTQIYGPSHIDRHNELFSSLEVKSLLCAPLQVRNKISGVLLLWSKSMDFFKARETPMIHLFANQVALAVHNADLHIQNRELAVQQERYRLARELHDSVTQTVYFIGMAAQAALKFTEQKQDDRATKTVELIHALSRTALTEIRNNLHELNPTVIDKKRFGTILKHFCESLKEQFDLNVVLKIDPAVELTGNQAENLYSIAKEALWNVVKHADTNQAEVVLTKNSGAVILTIEDKGSGFNFSPSSTIATIGLRSIKERVELLEGSLTIKSKPGWGTQIEVSVPLRQPK